MNRDRQAAPSTLPYFLFAISEIPVDKQSKLGLSSAQTTEADENFRSQLFTIAIKADSAHLKYASEPLAANQGSPELPKLSSRQQQILICIIQGHQNKVIADLLGIEIVTVKMHIGILFKKLGVKNRTKAAVRGIGLLQDGADDPEGAAMRTGRLDTAAT